MIALLDYFLLMACVFLWHFYGEQDLNSINKPTSSILMKLTTINFYTHKINFIGILFHFNYFYPSNQPKKKKKLPVELNSRTKQNTEKLFSLNNCFCQNVV